MLRKDIGGCSLSMKVFVNSHETYFLLYVILDAKFVFLILTPPQRKLFILVAHTYLFINWVKCPTNYNIACFANIIYTITALFGTPPPPPKKKNKLWPKTTAKSQTNYR